MHLNVADLLPDQILVKIENNMAIDVKAATTQELVADITITAYGLVELRRRERERERDAEGE